MLVISNSMHLALAKFFTISRLTKLQLFWVLRKAYLYRHFMPSPAVIKSRPFMAKARKLLGIYGKTE